MPSYGATGTAFTNEAVLPSAYNSGGLAYSNLPQTSVNDHSPYTVLVSREEHKQPFQSKIVVGVRIADPDEAAALSGKSFVLELSPEMRQAGFRVDRLVAPDFTSVILVNTDNDEEFRFPKDSLLGFWSEPRDYRSRDQITLRPQNKSMKSISTILKFVAMEGFPKLGINLTEGWSPVGYLLRLPKFSRIYIPGISEQDIDSSTMAMIFFYGLTPSAAKLYEPYREYLMGLKYDHTEYPYRTWQNPDMMDSPGWMTNSFQGAAVSIAFSTFSAYVDNAEAIIQAMNSRPNGPIQTVSALHGECMRLEMIDSWGKVGDHLRGDGTHSYYALIDRHLDPEVRRLLRQSDFYSGSYDPLLDRVTFTRPWAEYYSRVERVLRMHQIAGLPKARNTDTLPLPKPRGPSLGVHFMEDTPDESEQVYSFEDIKRILNDHSSKLENIQLQQAQVLHAATVPKVIHTPTSSGPLRAFGNAGVPPPPRTEGPPTAELQSPSQRDDRGEHRDTLPSYSRDSQSGRHTPPGRSIRDRERYTSTSPAPSQRRSARAPVPNRDFLAFLQQTAQQDDIWSEQVSDLVDIATIRFENAHLLEDDFSSDSDC